MLGNVAALELALPAKGRESGPLDTAAALPAVCAFPSGAHVAGVTCVHDEGGQLLSGSFMGYAMPRAETLRGITLKERPVPSPNNPLGVEGAGVRRVDMPASAQRVWAALQAASA